jgi:hypothetical protein
MTEEKYPADVVSYGAPRARRASGRRWTGFLAHRWPTAVGVAVGGLTAFDLRLDAGFVASLSALVVVLALVYLGSAALGRRWSAWAVLLAGLPVAFFLAPFSGVAAAAVLLLASLLFLVMGVARGRQGVQGGLALQAAGVLAFGAVMLAALYADPTLGAYLVAFGLLGHGAWDAYHYLKDRVVARSYAEFCAVLDLLVGAAILFVLFVR